MYISSDNKYNKQLVNDDNNDGSNTRHSLILDKQRYNSFRSNNSSSNIHNYSGLSYGLSFFLDERRKHYKKLNKLIFSELISLKNNGSNQFGLFEYLRLKTCHLSTYAYKDAVLHLKKHNQDLPELIENVLQGINTHNSKVNELYEIILNHIDEYFLSQSDSPISRISFIPDNIKTQALGIWYDSVKSITNITNIQEISKNIDKQVEKLPTENRADNTELYINSMIIGKGDKNSADRIRTSFITLLKNEEILKKLVYLVNRSPSLNKDVDYIVNNVKEISESIKQKYYNEKLSCCPSILKLLHKYGI